MRLWRRGRINSRRGEFSIVVLNSLVSYLLMPSDEFCCTRQKIIKIFIYITCAYTLPSSCIDIYISHFLFISEVRSLLRPTDFIFV